MADNNIKLRIKDIARLSGVSVGTVDRVLHNRGEVAEGTRKNVMKIIDQLNYKPNLFARTLALKRPYKIATLIPDFRSDNKYWMMPYKGILKAVEELKDFNTEIETFHFNQFDKEYYIKQFHSLFDYKPDGAVIVPSFFPFETANLIKELNIFEIPYIFIDSTVENANNLCFIGQNTYQSGYLAGKILNYGLKGQGDILIIKIANQNIFSNALITRVNGFKSFFKDNDNYSSTKIIEIEVLEISKYNLKLNLEKYINTNSAVKGIYVPNSKVFLVAEFLEKNNIKGNILVGHDLLDESIKYLNSGIIDFLNAQNPEEQGYKAIINLFNYLALQREINKVHYFPLDIITKENFQFYL